MAVQDFRKSIIFIGLLTCLFLHIPVTYTMQMNRTPIKNSVVYNPNIQPTILTSLERAYNSQQAIVAVDSFILTDRKIINLLIKIHAKHPDAVTVHVHESNTHNKKTIEQLIAEGITVEKSPQHTKRLAIQFKNNDETQWHRHTLTGSYNLTENARKNKEMMVVAVSDSPDHRDHSTSHVRGMKRDRTHQATQLLDNTPDKKLVLDTATHDLHACLAPRIDNAQSGDTIYFGSMNYGEPLLHAALLKAAQRKVFINILLDTDAAAQKNIPLLDQLEKEGVSIVFPTGTLRTKGTDTLLAKKGIFHQKYMVRAQADKTLAYVSTANATEHAQHDFNVGTYYPEHEEVAQDIITSHRQLATQGTTYQQFKAAGAQLPKRSHSKKLFPIK